MSAPPSQREGGDWGAAVGASFAEQLRRVRAVLWRGKGLIAAIIVLVLVPTFLYLQQVRPRFTAQAEVLVEAPDTGDTLLDRSNASRTRLTEATILTEAEVLAATPLARRVIEKLRLDQDPEFNPRLRKPEGLALLLAQIDLDSWLPESWRRKKNADESLTPAARAEIDKARITGVFLSRLTVKAQRRSFVIIVQMTTEDREKSARIVNTLADLYVLDRLEAGFDETRRVTGWLTERLDMLRRDVSAAEQAVETYRATYNLRRKADRGTVTDQQLTEINSKLVLARADMAQKQARLDQVRALQRGRGSVETAFDVLQSSLIQRLREQESTIQREISEAAKTYGDRHPKLVGLRADLGELRGKIGLEIERIAIGVANEVEVAASGLRVLEAELSGLRQQTDAAGGAEIRLRELEREADTSRELYQAYLARLKRDTEQERIQRANARVLSPADIPIRPSFPRQRAVLLIAGLIGLGLGVGLVFLLDRLDTAIRSSDEAEQLTGLPVFAAVPLLRGRAKPDDDLFRQPRGQLAESVRALRTALVLSAPDGAAGGRVLAVTSSVPGEGKSFVALALARMFAKSGERVLLIDGDMHRPRLHRVLGISGEHGFAQVLSGGALVDELVVRDPQSGLDVLPAGAVAAGRGGETIDGAVLERTLAYLRDAYDRVVIDTPPVLAVADSRLLAGAADRVLYLVRWNKTPREAVRNGLKLLRETRANLAGLALSQVDRRRHARYGYGDYGQYYGRYGGYYSE